MRLLLTATLTLLATVCFSQKITRENNNRINAIYNNISNAFYLKDVNLYLETNSAAANERKYSYLWPLCALIQTTNELETLFPKKKYMDTVIKAIDAYYTKRAPKPGYQAYIASPSTHDDRYYDDNQWVAIAYMDAYKRTGKKEYLTLSKEIYDFMLVGYDAATGGGIYWRENDFSSKNTCSNGPGILVALQLYEATKDKAYLDTALSLYNWVNKYLRSSDGVYYDAIRTKDNSIDDKLYTYNTGTMLQSNMILYRITKDAKYLSEAQFLAAGAKKHFVKDGKLPGHYWFNAVLLRGLIDLYNVDKDSYWIDLFRKDLERIWVEERDEHNFLGKGRAKSLIDQAAYLEMMLRLLVLK